MYIPIANLEVRQSDSTEPQPQCMSGGSIAGIVIGSIAGTLFLLWLFTTLRNNTSDEGYRHGSVETSRTYDGRRRHRRHSSAGVRPSSRSYSTYETTERPAKVIYRN